MTILKRRPALSAVTKEWAVVILISFVCNNPRNRHALQNNDSQQQNELYYTTEKLTKYTCMHTLYIVQVIECSRMFL